MVANKAGRPAGTQARAREDGDLHAVATSGGGMHEPARIVEDFVATSPRTVRDSGAPVAREDDNARVARDAALAQFEGVVKGLPDLSGVVASALPEA